MLAEAWGPIKEKNLEYEIETNIMVDVYCTHCVAIKEKNLEYEIETCRIRNGHAPRPPNHQREESRVRD